MSKFYGNIGFSTEMTEKSPGVWEDNIVVKPYYGDMIKRVRRWQSGDGVNDNLTISNTLEIIADEFIVQNLTNIRYVEWFGSKWSVSDVTIEYPRMTLTLGGVFNERQTGTP
jgi:hypothetical protein